MKDKNKPCIGYKISKVVLGTIFKVMYRPTIINKEYIPKEGPIFVCGNHKHVFDQNLAILATKRTLHYMAKKEYFDGKYAWFFRWVGCIPVNREIHDENAKQSAIKILENNGGIGIFPEGTRNKTEAFLLPFKFGAVSMAQKTNATIVPFGLTGEYKKGKDNNLMIRFGKPFKVENMSLEEANAKLEKMIGNLMKQNLKETKKNISNKEYK